MDQLEPRTRVSTGGEVRSVRIVPRAGAPALEVTLNDGHGTATAVFLGRRKIAGLAPGKRIAISGMVAKDGKRLLIYNPEYVHRLKAERAATQRTASSSDPRASWPSGG